MAVKMPKFAVIFLFQEKIEDIDIIDIVKEEILDEVSSDSVLPTTKWAFQLNYFEIIYPDNFNVQLYQGHRPMN